MKTFDFTIREPAGVHARPAGVLVQKASTFESELLLRKGDTEVDLKKLLSLMQMNIQCGERVTISAQGPDEDTAIESIEAVCREIL